jgi:hypothetical protein
MKLAFTMPMAAREGYYRLRSLCGAAALCACLIVVGCTTGEFGSGSDAARSPIVQKPGNFESALKYNQRALAKRDGSEEVALYNIGVILSHPENPRRDGIKAARAFKTLVAEHPRSPYVEQAKTWIEVLEQQQKLAEEKRILARERESLLEERQRLNYANEKSQQLDMQIEKRRRQSLGR